MQSTRQSADESATLPKLQKVRAAAKTIAKAVANKAPTPFTVVDYLLRFKLSHSKTLSKFRFDDAALFARIEQDGFAILEGYWSADQCDDTVADIERMFEQHPEHIHAFSDRRIFGAEELSANIARFANDAKVAALSNAYNHVKTVNAFTMANKVVGSANNKGSGEGWHKDSSFRQFKGILYLNDVGESNGPFQVIRKSHTLPSYLRDMRTSDMQFRDLRISEEQVAKILAPDPSRLTTATGRRGTLILVDTACIHRGRPAREGMRYALTNYYVERFQINPAFVSAYRPVSPDKVRRMRETSFD